MITMVNPPLLLIQLLIQLLLFHPSSANSALYFPNPSLLSSDYHNMLTTFKIFIYDNPPPQNDVVSTPNSTTPSSISMFYTSLLNSSQFLTRDPHQAHLFFLPFGPDSSTRSLAREIQRVRKSYSFWDRALGADHFYLSCSGVGPSSSRNVVELKKNAVQISCFPSSPAGEFIPHKDLTLPPLLRPSSLPLARVTPSKTRLAYWKFNPLHSGSSLFRTLRDDPDFLIESEPSDEPTYIERLQSSKFCLFPYEVGQMELFPVALAHGCVPVLLTDHRPIQDLPFMDLIRWSKIALFVESRAGHERVKGLMINVTKSGAYEKMRGLGVAAAQHFVWEGESETYDAFHMVMYQLWKRRHVIRYEPWELK